MNIGQYLDRLRREQGVPLPEPSRVFSYMPDIRPYRSPVGTGEISGRVARREDLKRAGCREVDPSELGSFSRLEQERRKVDFLPGEVMRSKPDAR